MPTDTCIYCLQENTEPSSEHVTARALGADIELPGAYVCKSCNNKFDEEIDRPVQEDLLPILVEHQIEGRRGNVPYMKVTEEVEGELRTFRIESDEIKQAARRKPVDREEGIYLFRANSREALEEAKSDLQKKNPDKEVTLEIFDEQVPDLPPARIDEVDFREEHWVRWGSKTCLNVVAHQFEPEVARRRSFDVLREFALGKGGIPPLTSLIVSGTPGRCVDVDDLEEKHVVHVWSRGGTLRVKVSLFGFCFAECKICETGAPDYATKITIDATEQTHDCDGDWGPPGM